MTWTIGASEAAKPLGLCPYDSPFSFWAKKTGRLAKDPDNRAMEWGNRMEPLILDDFERRHDVRLIRCTCGARHPEPHAPDCKLPPMFHPRRQWERATPDALIVRSNCSSSFIERFEIDE